MLSAASPNPGRAYGEAGQRVFLLRARIRRGRVCLCEYAYEAGRYLAEHMWCEAVLLAGPFLLLLHPLQREVLRLLRRRKVLRFEQRAAAVAARLVSVSSREPNSTAAAAVVYPHAGLVRAEFLPPVPRRILAGGLRRPLRLEVAARPSVRESLVLAVVALRAGRPTALLLLELFPLQEWLRSQPRPEPQLARQAWRV